MRQHQLGTIFIAPLDVILDPRRADMVLEVMSANPRIGDLRERIGWFCESGVRECWLVHQLTREIEVLQLEHGGVLGRRTHRGLESIESTVLPFFAISPEVLAGW